jgi:hypothetical protein
MSTGTVVINRTLRQLLSGVVEQKNKLAAPISASATSLTTLYDLDGLRKGAVFEIDSELFYVWEATAGSKTLTVERGFNGTIPAAHSANAIITNAPRFPRSQILEALNDELKDLSSPVHGLYQVKHFDFEYNGSDYIINLQHALKQQYRPGARWMMADNVLAEVRAIKDASSAYYLWNPDPSAGFGGRLLGSPVEIDDNMPSTTSNAYAIAYGDFSRAYAIVRRTGIALIRDNITAKGTTKFNFRRRVGGGVINFEAVKLMRFATS